MPGDVACNVSRAVYFAQISWIASYMLPTLSFFHHKLEWSYFEMFHNIFHSLSSTAAKFLLACFYNTSTSCNAFHSAWRRKKQHRYVTIVAWTMLKAKQCIFQCLYNHIFVWNFVTVTVHVIYVFVSNSVHCCRVPLGCPATPFHSLS